MIYNRGRLITHSKTPTYVRLIRDWFPGVTCIGSPTTFGGVRGDRLGHGTFNPTPP